MSRRPGCILRNRFRAAIVLAVAFALLIAPVIVVSTHSAMDAAASEQIAYHGHSHGDLADISDAGHDATDHEHQMTALLHSASQWARSARPLLSTNVHLDLEGVIREGPRRPPRSV